MAGAGVDALAGHRAGGLLGFAEGEAVFAEGPLGLPYPAQTAPKRALGATDDWALRAKGLPLALSPKGAPGVFCRTSFPSEGPPIGDPVGTPSSLSISRNAGHPDPMEKKP